MKLKLKNLSEHVLSLILSEPVGTQIVLQKEIEKHNFELFLITTNISEGYVTCHYFHTDSIDQRYEEYEYFSVPLRTVNRFYELVSENKSILYTTKKRRIKRQYNDKNS